MAHSLKGPTAVSIPSQAGILLAVRETDLLRPINGRVSIPSQAGILLAEGRLIRGRSGKPASQYPHRRASSWRVVALKLTD